MKELMSKEDYAWLKEALDTNTTGLEHIDKHIYVRMFGYKD